MSEEIYKKLLKQLKRIADALESIEIRGRGYIIGSKEWMKKGVKHE